MTGSLEIGNFLRRQSVSIFRANAHALHSTGFLGWLLEGSSGSFRSKNFVRKQTMCKSLYPYLTICFAFEKPCWLLHNTADRAETVFSHLNQIRSIKDIDKMIQQTAHCYTLGWAWPALEQFKQGLSDRGVLEAINNPNAFTLGFCHFPEKIDAVTFSCMFTVLHSEEGSNKRDTENLIMSYWHDYLQDTGDGHLK